MNEPTAVLRAEALVKTYQEGGEKLNALDGVSLTVRRGESVVVTGPSGSGKSTLIGILAGLDEPTSGTVILDNQDLSALSEDQLAQLRARKIGFVFQSFRLLQTLTAEENVRIPLELAGDTQAESKARAWLDQVGLSERYGHLPAQLSGGEQQRVALARALAVQPDLLFADEPTGNLDSKNGAAMADLIFELVKKHGAALILVTHEQALAARADRRITLKDGRIV